MTFQIPPVRTNTVLRLKQTEAGAPSVAEVIYAYEGKDYVTQRLTVRQHERESGKVPLEFVVEIFARLGVEFTRGQPSHPTPGVEYSQVLEKYEVVVDQISPIADQDLVATDLSGFAIKVMDQRIGGGDFPLVYRTSNGIPTESKIRTDHSFSSKIAALERAQKSFIPSTVQTSTSKRAFVRVLILSISAGALIFLLKSVWRTNKNQ